MSEHAMTVTCQSCYFSNSVSTGQCKVGYSPSLLTLNRTIAMSPHVGRAPLDARTPMDMLQHLHARCCKGSIADLSTLNIW